MKFMRLLMFGTVMLMANGAGAQNSVKPFHLDEPTISDVHAAYKSGALTSVRLVQAYLERIRACDQAGPKLNVVIFLNPRALEEAAALDACCSRLGCQRSRISKFASRLSPLEKEQIMAG
jgi:amidase